MLRPSHRLLLAAGLLALAACQNKGSKWNNPRDEAAFHPANLTAGGTVPPPSGVPSAAAGEKTGALLDAMLGQVNGKPLYAQHILKPMEPELKRLGRDLPLREFVTEAKKLVTGALISAIRDAQMLAKAEGHLKDGQKAGLNGIIERHREELLRQYGEGSLALAKANLFRDKGVTMEEELKHYREEQLVGYYMFEKVTPLINVTRRDIERYYYDHPAEFNKPETRQIRLLHAASPLAGMQIAESLKKGKTFEEVASDPALNTFNPSKGGAFEDPIVGKPELFSPELSQATATLKAKGAWGGPVLVKEGDVWFVEVAAYSPGISRTLDESQLDIRNILSNEQRKKLSDRIYAQAAQEGSCSDPAMMAETLLNIAIFRYAVK